MKYGDETGNGFEDAMGFLLNLKAHPPGRISIYETMR